MSDPYDGFCPPPLVNEELIVNVMTVLWFNCQLSILNAQIINAPPHAIDNQNQAITGLGLMLWFFANYDIEIKYNGTLSVS